MRYFWILTALLALLPQLHAEDWPQWMGLNRDGRWNEKGTINEFNKGAMQILWRTAVQGGYSGPAVSEGKVYLMDFSRDAGELKNNPDGRNKIRGHERTLCLDARSGSILWEDKYPCDYEISYACGPRCTPTVMQGKVYSLGAEGHLRCLDAKAGKLLWAKDLKAEFKLKESPIWGYCSHPLVFEDKVILAAGAKEGILAAFDKLTGKEIWKAIPMPGGDMGYCPPDVIEVGVKKQISFWSPEALYGVNPGDGKVLWSHPLKPKYAMSIMSPRKSGEYLFAGGIGPAGALLQFDGEKPKEVWKGDRSKGVHPVNATPVIEEGYIYGVDQPGMLRCVELATGKQLWETLEPTTKKPRAASSSGTSFLVKNYDKYFLFSEVGDLIIAKLSPTEYKELSRLHILEPTGEAFGRSVVWSHPAFANGCCFARNDKEIVCVSLRD